MGVYPEALTESDMYDDTSLLQTRSNQNCQFLPTTLPKKGVDSIEQFNTSDIEGILKRQYYCMNIIVVNKMHRLTK